MAGTITNADTVETIIAKLREEADRNHTDNRRPDQVEKFVRGIIKNYSEKLGYSELDILKGLESKRDYWCVNYYQEAKLPMLDDRVMVFENMDKYREQFPSHKFICPHCNGITTDPYECNSGVLVNLISTKKKGKKEPCNWKSYGLFGTIGKGVKIIIKDTFLEHTIVTEMFQPVELAEKEAVNEHSL